MLSKLQGWLTAPPKRDEKFASQSHPPITNEHTPALVYAIGDIHGCLELLNKMEAQIKLDAGHLYDSCVILYLGDVVDRGPDSASILDKLSFRHKTGPTRITLFGNHEEMMLHFLEAPSAKSPWLLHGGAETLASYGIHADTNRGWNFSTKHWRYLLAANVPEAHIDFLANLPRSYQFGPYFASHAGINPDLSLAEQTLRDLLWSRPSDKPFKEDVFLVHGHTPVDAPYLSKRRINIDTGAYATGTLSAVCLAPDQAPRVLQVKR